MPSCSPRPAGSCSTGTPGRASRLPGFSRSNTRPTSPCGPARRAWPCPRSSEAGTAGPSEDALLVYRLPAGTTLSEADAASISDATLADLYRHLLTLRQARIAHGAISGDTLLIDPAAETVAVADFRNATSNASPDQLDRDMAGGHSGDGRGGRRATGGGRAARCLTRRCWPARCSICIAPRSIPCSAGALRGKRELLKDVRQRAAQAGSIDVPKLVEPRRVSWPTLIMMVGHAHRRLGTHRGAHRRVQVLRHRDRG